MALVVDAILHKLVSLDPMSNDLIAYIGLICVFFGFSCFYMTKICQISEIRCRVFAFVGLQILVHSFNNGNNNQKKNRVNNIRKNKIRRDLRGSTLRSLVRVLRFKIFESRKCFLVS